MVRPPSITSVWPGPRAFRRDVVASGRRVVESDARLVAGSGEDDVWIASERSALRVVPNASALPDVEGGAAL